jgi:TonB family protein
MPEVLPNPGSELLDTQEGDLQFVVAPESRTSNFIQNFWELFRRGDSPATTGDTADFWSDVFVRPGVPWLRFCQSAGLHALAITLVLIASRFPAMQPQALPQPKFTHDDVIYYTSAESLPPIDTRPHRAARAQKSDPERSAQAIISLPPQADNHSQTIVTAPALKLHREVSLRNVVAWTEKRQVPIGPAPVVLASQTSRIAPRVKQSVVAPPPDLANNDRAAENPSAPRLSVIAPPPEMQSDSSRRFGDLDISHSRVIAPAPRLTVDAQRAGRTATGLNPRSVSVIAPPPAVGASAASPSSGNMIALSLHPSVAPPAPVAGNRRGSFASTPEGHFGASGAPTTAGKMATVGNGSNSAARTTTNLPSGLYVGKPANPPSTTGGDGPGAAASTNSVNPNLIANARPPRVSLRTLQPQTEGPLSEEERAVFGNRRFYSLSLNMPNLNSGGGSWVIRFAALGTEADSKPSYSRAADTSRADATHDALSAPSATRKVDPAYPLELMRQNVSGTVVLYAVIHKDGRVGNIRVLRSADDRLDRYASQAIAKWQFEPATKNGAPVDVEATFRIPFKPAKTSSGF